MVNNGSESTANQFNLKNQSSYSSMSSSVEYKRLSSTSSDHHSSDETTKARSTSVSRRNSNPWQDKIGLSWSYQTILVFVVWYLFSFLTLFFNKYILMDERNDPVVLGMINLVTVSVM